jgi:uncharacterized protein (TIGR00156 family)
MQTKYSNKRLTNRIYDFGEILQKGYVMKTAKILAAVAIVSLVATSASAQFHGNGVGGQKARQGAGGGFRGETVVTSVAAADGLRDDAPIVMRGYIKNSLGDEKYTFSDGTGTITVEIDHRAWRGLNVTSGDFVEISGEVDRDTFYSEIDVDYIRLAK